MGFSLSIWLYLIEKNKTARGWKRNPRQLFFQWLRRLSGFHYYDGERIALGVGLTKLATVFVSRAVVDPAHHVASRTETVPTALIRSGLSSQPEH